MPTNSIFGYDSEIDLYRSAFDKMTSEDVLKLIYEKMKLSPEQNLPSEQPMVNHWLNQFQKVK